MAAASSWRSNGQVRTRSKMASICSFVMIASYSSLRLRGDPAIEGKNLRRVEQPARVEDAAHAHLLLQVRLGELAPHEVALLDADAVLAGEAAADLDAELQDVVARPLGLFHLARLVDVEQDQRVQVAVAGVEHVGHAEPLRAADLVDALQHMRQL